MIDDEYEIRARLDDAVKKDETFSKSDPFNGNWDSLKSLDGLEANFKRRISRSATKMIDPTTQYTTAALAPFNTVIDSMIFGSISNNRFDMTELASNPVPLLLTELSNGIPSTMTSG